MFVDFVNYDVVQMIFNISWLVSCNVILCIRAHRYIQSRTKVYTYWKIGNDFNWNGNLI